MRTGAETRIVTARFVAVCITSLAALTSFYLLLSTVPLFTAEIGDVSDPGRNAGLATGALMLSTVLAEIVTPRLLGWLGPRPIFAAALVCLGLPALLLPATDSVVGVLVVCLVRGLGFGIAVVVGGALVAELAPPGRRGESLGLYGVVVTVPAVAALPLGVWLVEAADFSTTFIVGGIAATVGLLLVPALRGRTDQADDHVGISVAMGSADLRRPALVFTATALAGGVVVTFLPLATPAPSSEVVTLGLFAQALTATVARWVAGRVGDRRGAATLLAPGVVLSAAGIGLLLLLPTAGAVLIGMAVFGAGFGIVQNASFSLMFDRSSPGGYGAVSGMWNLAYDVGLGAGAVGFGLVVAQTGYPAGFALVAGLVCAVLPVVLFDRSRTPTSPP